MTERGVNLADFLHEMAEKTPFKRAVIYPETRDSRGRRAYTHFTFKQLKEETDRICGGLSKIGIKRGTRTVLMVKPSLEFFSLTFSLFKLGAVIVLVDPGIGLENLKRCLDEAEPEAFIGIPKAQAARVLLRWASKSIRTVVTVGRRMFWGGYTFEDIRLNEHVPFDVVKMPPDEIGAIMFTSGSTGTSKGVVYTHGILTNQVKFLQETYKFMPDEIDLATFPLFALLDIALGLTVIIPDMDATAPARADPEKLIEAINDHGATMMFGSPALLNTLSRYTEPRKIVFPTLRRVISAGAPARIDVLRRFQKCLPEGAEIFTPYGATEALPVTSIGSREILEKFHAITEKGGGTCIGFPNPNLEVKIIKITDDPIPEWSEGYLVPPGEIGEIVVKGPIVTREYFRRPEATKLAKIYNPDGSFWHRMGDLGRFDEEGRLWFCGRKSQRVETGSETLFTIPCEAIFNQHPKVFRSALVGVGEKGSQIPVICIELEKDVPFSDLEVIKKELLKLGASYPHTQKIKHILFHDEFPVDVRHNAKIGREKLAIWAAEQLKYYKGDL